MNIVLNLVEQWGLLTIAGVILIYFAWHLIAFVREQPVAIKSDPILSVTTFGWGSIWLLGNGGGNSLFLYTIGTLLYDLVVFYTGNSTLQSVPGSEALIFLIALMPSLYQFRYQANPDYLATLSPERRAVAIALTVADGLLCAVGWYWWLLPPTLADGQFVWIYDQTLAVGCLVWGMFSSYVAQFMAHMQLYEWLGLQAPRLPNPLSGTWMGISNFFAFLRPSAQAEDELPQRAPQKRHPSRTRHPQSSKRTPAHASTPSDFRDYSDSAVPALHFEELGGES